MTALSTKLQLIAPAAGRSVARVVGGPDSRPAGEALTRAEIRRYQDNGFLALPDLCDAEEVTLIRTTLLGLFNRRAGRNEGTQFDMLGLDSDGTEPRQPQIVKPSVFAPALLRTAYFRRLLAAARQLLGDGAQFSFDHSILKPARSAAPTPWHQDEAHHDHAYLRVRQISFWMPLQDTPMELGCMRYIPRSDRGPLLPHHRLNDDPRVHAIECSTNCFDETLAIAVPAAAGSCILHDGRTLHSALANVSAEDRLAYIVAFTVPPVLSRDVPRAKLASNDTANMHRRRAWLLHGGFLVYGLRRVRQALRSDPRTLWPKLCTLAGVLRLRALASMRKRDAGPR